MGDRLRPNHVSVFIGSEDRRADSSFGGMCIARRNRIPPDGYHSMLIRAYRAI